VAAAAPAPLQKRAITSKKSRIVSTSPRSGAKLPEKQPKGNQERFVTNLESPTAKQLITLIQTEFPLDAHPYAVMGAQLGISEGEAFAITEAFIENKSIRRIGATLDSRKLGYFSTLCAIAVTDPGDIDSVAALINSYPGVTHNYQRQNRYNIWFTLIAPSPQAVDDILAQIAEKSGYTAILNLPAVRLFKIRVSFDVSGSTSSRSVSPAQTPHKVTVPAEVQALSFSAVDKALIRHVQDDLAGSLTPFAVLAEQISEELGSTVTEEQLLARSQELKDAGAIRRFGAIVRHHKLGLSDNVMCAWDIPEPAVETAGKIMAESKNVSHCYQRVTAPTWRFNLYTMVHGSSRDECTDAIESIHNALSEREIFVDYPALLFSERELKKTSMRYFVE
jgi:DNA-binding Lrp family transcriptional regulator